MKINRQNAILAANQIGPGIQFRGSISNGGNHPPRNRIEVMPDIRIMLAYSPRKNRAKAMPEYSTLYPATSSASASGKSNGWRLVSARVEMKKTTAIGNSGITNHRSRCASTIADKFSEPTQSSTVMITKPMDTS